MGRTMTAMQLARKRFPEHDSDRLQAFFACRNVWIADELVTDSQMKVPSDSPIEIKLDEKYVSRGGLKLEHALDCFGLDVRGLVMLDAGASTGGFTDCLLQRGAALVHSVDVGYNQLDFRLRKDSRVVVHERQNIMALQSLNPPADAAVADLSFRSISGAASHIMSLVSRKILIALIKPQFEVPRWQAGFDGVVKDPMLLRQVMAGVRETLNEDGCGIVKLTASPIRGRKGNVEFLAWLEPEAGMDEPEFKQVLERCLSEAE